MKTFLQNYFDELKQQIIGIAGIKTITSSDCYRLSLDIEEKTQKRISETTLKRIFGFAMAQYKPSIFTLNTLAEFCGYESWNAFLAVMENKQLTDIENVSWHEIKQNALQITRFSIETNKLKSGIPYHFTIPRRAFETSLNQFLSEEATACIISAPAGGGKTICLTQWIDSQIHQNPSKDIFLFINLFTLAHSTGFGYDGNQWLSFILGIHQKGILDKFLETYKRSSPGMFYLVIDDMNNALISDKQFNIIFLQLVDMVNHFSKFPWFKIVISLRPATWEKYKHLIEGNDAIQKLWFTGFISEEEKESGKFSYFTYQEIQKLTASLKNSPYIESECVHERLSIISLPLHFQYYYQLKGGKICLEKINLYDQFAIEGMSLNKNVLNGTYHVEKKILLDKLSKLIGYTDHTISIEKHKAFPILKEFRSAYKELLYTGTLHEHRGDFGSRVTSEIRFHSLVSGAYFLAQRFLRKNHNLFDIKLIHNLNRAHYPLPIKKAVLNWLIIFAFESGSLALTDHFSSIEFIEDDVDELILFTCNCLYDIIDKSPALGKKLKDQFINHRLLEYILEHISMKPDYKQALQYFSTFTLSEQQRIMLHSALGLTALIHLKDDETAFHIEKLREINPEAYAVFALNPLTHLESLYFYLKYGLIRREALEEVTLFNFHPERNKMRIHLPINFALAYMSSKISGNVFKTLRFLRAVQQYQIRNKISFPKVFTDFIQLSKAYERLKNGQLEKAESIQHATSTNSKGNINLHIVRIIYQMKLAWVKQHSVLQQHREVIAVCKQHDFRFFEAITRIFMLETHSTTEHPTLIEEHSSALKMLFKESGYRVENFMNWGRPSRKLTSPLETN